ncbi:MAG: hypothetical protein HOC71_11280 [Candidatus Latescibacteria bacterium]|jgi:negative regulator of replication initiation|nr:hypothetical protein [Candidatus Latescibacterota bacterium]
MNYYKIEVDEDVYKYLKQHATPFEDTPNSVLRKILAINKSDINNLNNDAIKNLPNFSSGFPEALSQTLIMIFLVKKENLSRKKATNYIAKIKRIRYQTVISKYTTQLGKKVYEIDRLLDQINLNEFKSLLEKKFPNNKNYINNFFNEIQKTP